MTDLKDIRHFRETTRLLQRLLNGQSRSDAACCGITVAQCHALMEIGNNREISIVDLALILGLDKSTLSRTIDGMARLELVERKTNPEDRRYLNLTLSDKGISIFNRINRVFDDYYRGVFSGIPPGKRRQVIESVRLLAEAASKRGSFMCRREEI